MAFKICDVLGVKEGQEFFLANEYGTEYTRKYRIKNNELQYYSDIYHKLYSKSLSTGEIQEDTRKVSWNRS